MVILRLVHLKSLTLKGFKSFASATTLRFEPGITCVVGPNGSGKSNVVDALTWVMGEQGAKALRGGKMQDVIFAGTSGRAPLGRAEVTLTIDNSDGELPIDYSEVSITRRMFRDGAGEYEINGNSCRLMDVQELLSDSGIGREMHVIVGQGRLSAILESRPEDRRAFIEEAAGVLKHRRRKEKAVRKLDSMQANLARLTDLTTELRRQLKPLGRQAEIARRAQTVQADLRDARLRLAADDLVARRREMAEHTDGESQVREQQQRVAAELDALTGEMNGHEAELERIAPAAKDAAATWFRLSALAERVDGTCRVAAERSRHLTDPVEHKSGRDPEQLEADAEKAAGDERELTEAVEMATETLETVRAELAEAEDRAAAAEKAHLAAVRAIADRREGLARLEGQVENLRTRAESTDADAARLGAAIEEAAQRSEEASAELDVLTAKVAELEAAESGLDEHHERCVRAFNQANERVAELREAEREVDHRIAGLTARIEALSVTLERRDGPAWLLENHRERLLGSLTDLMTVHNGFETAMAAALGPAAEALAAPDAAAARDALATLRDQDAGRAWMLLADVSRADTPSGVDLPAGARWAIDVVTVADHLRGALDAVLGATVVADSPQIAEKALTALAEAGVEPRSARAVTTEGDLFGPGWMSGGSDRRPSTLEIASAIDTAETDLVAARREAESVAAALEGATSEQTARREAAEESLAALHESDSTLNATYDQLARVGDTARAAQTQSQRLVSQRAVAETGHADALDALEQARERLRLARSESGDPTAADAGDFDGLGGDRDAAAAVVASARATEMDARLALRTAEERLASVRGRAESLRRAARAEREARERAERQNRARARAAEVSATVSQAGALVAERISLVVEQAARHRDQLEATRAERAAALEEVRGRVRDLGKTLASLRDAVHRDEVAKAQAALRLEQIEEQIVSNYSIAPDDLVAEYGPDVPLPPTALEIAEYEQARERGEQVSAPVPMPFDRATQEARAKKAQKDLTTLGKVNPLALEEFAALEERYNFLSTQLEDVKSARKDLLDVVEEVDAKILQVFTEAYADVEREFAQVFTTLFPGGEGRLVLTDPSDMLTTGVEVEARPPGKKVKRLSLLSGGEKSLTAVAMLVAIFRARPSPFYVMDEVEAALDDTNLRRLITLFEQLREKSQLIVITHQKPTMEIADALYGVSMRGDGITTVISQRLRGMDLPASSARAAGSPAVESPADVVESGAPAG